MAFTEAFQILSLTGERPDHAELSSIEKGQVVTITTTPVATATNDLAEAKEPHHYFALLEIFRWRRRSNGLDTIAMTRSVYDDLLLAPLYKPHSDYENLHQFDPLERWTHRKEHAGRQNTDLKVFVWILVTFFALNIDRGNLTLAAADNLLDDLGINTDDNNNAQNMYRVGFLISEISSQMLGKRFGPDRWTPIQIIIWSLASGGQFFMRNRADFFTCRFFVGLFMGGFVPDAVLYLSYFYKKNEVPIRLALFWFTNSLSGVIASFIACGVLHLRGVDGKEGWRWLFLIEALISVFVGFLSFLFLVPGPTQTRSWWNPQGYYSEKEEKIIVNRVLRDDPSKGGMRNREPLTLKMLWRSLIDYDLWPVYAIGILFEIPTAPPKAYLTLSLKTLKFSTFNTALLNIPVTIFASLTMLTVTYLTERLYQIALFGSLAQLWALPLLIIEHTSAQKLGPRGQYALTFVLPGQSSVHAAQVSWCSRLSNSVRTRAVNAAVYNIAVQLSGVASSNIYRDDDRPLYKRGNLGLIAICVATAVVYVLSKIYYARRNAWKQACWGEMSPEEKADYLASNKHQGNKRLEFVFDT